jgi:CBS domain containing-hemolysin-like protein
MKAYLLFLFLVGFCSILSFLFSGMEAGVFALSRLRIRQQMRAGKRQARVLHGFLENTENFLWTIFVGNTLVNFVAVSLVVFTLLQSLGLAQRPALLLLVLVGLVFLFYAFCDLLPKMLFRLYPNRLCLALAIPFRFIHSALAPLVSLMAWISKGLLRWSGGRTFTGNLFGSREELRQAIHESGVALTSEERAMINRVLDLQNLIVGEIALPMSKVLTATAQMSASDLLELYRQHRFSRVPVWRGSGQIRRIVGIVNLQALLYAPELPPNKTAGDFLKPALYLNEAVRLEDALQLMQRSGHRLAIVLGPDGSEAGIISLQDILKVVFGEVSL